MAVIRTTVLPFLLLWLACVSGSLFAAEADDFPGVEGLMDQQQFKEAGLHKLSPAELQALDRWLLQYTVGEAPELRRVNPEVKEAEEAFEVTSRVKPPFKGWTGKTVFHLENGQVWKQRLSGRYVYRGDDPSVVISKNFFGFYMMTVTQTGKSVGVTRLK